MWTDGIFDQHFLKRQRNNRLLSAVLDHPTLLGVGIDEATAAIVRDGRIEVVGRSAVVVFDPRGGPAPAPAAGQVSAGSVKVTVLREGMTYELKAGATPH